MSGRDPLQGVPGRSGDNSRAKKTMSRELINKELTTATFDPVSGAVSKRLRKSGKVIAQPHDQAARSHHRSPWTSEQLTELQALANEGKSARAIARQIGRTCQAVYQMSCRHRIALKRI